MDHRDLAAQKALLRERMAGFGWETERILAHVDDAPDFYLDQVAQVVMDSWHRGRVGLLGDAAFSASPMSGAGTGLALVGAYLLAGELAAADWDPEAGFAGYERRMRQYVEDNQEIGRQHVAMLLGPRRRPSRTWTRSWPSSSGPSAGRSCRRTTGADQGSEAAAAAARRARSPKACASSGGPTTSMSASNRPIGRRAPAQDHAPERRAGSGRARRSSTVPSPAYGATSRRGQVAGSPSPRQGQRAGAGSDALEPRVDERGDVAAGQLARREARTGGGARRDPVDAEGAPVVAVEVPGDEVPAAAPGDEVVRLDPARRASARARARRGR